MSDLDIQFDDIALGLDFEINDLQRRQLLGFIRLMDKWNKAYNLTSVRKPEEMLTKHIFDSIVIAQFLDKESYADVGTGPGLPGIPLAIMCPDKQFILIDSLGKRIRFIKQALHELKITNIIAIQSRVELIDDQKVDGVLSRAFASIKDMLQWCSHLIDQDGQFLALKGQLHQDELDEIPVGYTVSDTIKLKVPRLQGDRHLVKIKKV